MKSVPALSVVVPAYGVQGYISDCLSSILRQGLADMEVIVVDDASPDASGAIARQYATEDARVRVITHSQNRGLGASRNTGLDAARGEYVAFVDSDDLVADGVYPRLVALMNRTGSDFVTGPAEEFGSSRRWYWTTEGDAFDTPAERTTVAERPGLIRDHTAWNKVFRRSFLVDEGIRWPVGVKCEDVVPSTTAYARARAVDVVTAPVYYYRRRPGSITTSLGATITTADWVQQTAAAAQVAADLPPAVRAEFADKVLTTELLSRPRLEALAGAHVELVAAAADVVRTLGEWVRPDVLAVLSPVKRWEIAVVGAAAPTLLRTIWEPWAEPQPAELSALDAGSRGVFYDALGAGGRSPSEAFAARFVSRREVSSLHSPVLLEYEGAPEVSVVIPAHNVESFIDELLRSIRAAVGVRLEVIVVDDSSTDRTWERIQAHAAVDRRVRAYRSPGRGGGQARDFGIELACGEYLAFADGDDLVPPTGYASMLDAARRTGSEVITGNYLKLFANSTWNAGRQYSYALEVERVELSAQPQLARHRTCWNRLVRRDFWLANVFPFPGVPRANDIVPIMSALTAARSITVVPDVSYVYRDRPGVGSMTSLAGSLAYTTSYFSEERVCALMITQTGSAAVEREYWSMVLTVDGWGTLGKYLLARDQDDSSADEELGINVAWATQDAPASSIRAMSPEQQAVWDLVSAGEFDDAAVMYQAALNPKSVPISAAIDAVAAVHARGVVGRRPVARLFWKHVLRRVIDERSAVTLDDARSAITLLQALATESDDDPIAVPFAAEHLVIAALRSGDPAEVIAALEDQQPQPLARFVPSAQGGTFEGTVAPWVRRYLRVVVTMPVGGEVVRVPVARIESAEGSGRWKAQIDVACLPHVGRSNVELEIDDRWGRRRTRLVFKGATTSPIESRAARVVAVPRTRETSTVSIRAPFGRRVGGAARRVVRALVPRR